VQSEIRKSVPAAAEARPEGNHPPAIKEPTGQNADKQPVNHEKSVQSSDKKEQPPARENPAANEQNGPNPADKGHEDKVKE
jgi:hypothetical protein